MSKTQRILIIISLIFAILFGLILIAYSPFASWYNQKHQALVQTEYQEILENTDNDEINAAKEAAIQYNDGLAKRKFSYTTPETNGYFNQLNLAGNGIMGYVRIPSINVNLPIYHGTSDRSLSMGAGHMHETSLPVGGPTTHAVISAHSGMASNPFFTELERVDIGEFFYIDVLGEELVYQVDKIKTVLPSDIDDLEIKAGEDHVTLLTCTPYGVNTHRLLVRGTRVTALHSSNAPSADSDASSSDGEGSELPVRTQYYLRCILYGSISGLVLALCITFTLILLPRKRKNNDKENPNEESESNLEPASDPCVVPVTVRL